MEDNSKNVMKLQGENMSTIEIVVVPVTREQILNENTGTFRVTFPAAKSNSDLVHLSEEFVPSDQEVPVYKPFLNITNNS